VTKSELIEEFAREMGITIRDAGVCVNALFNSISDTLARDSWLWQLQGERV
jgi:nucleoid DNA-binding protein